MAELSRRGEIERAIITSCRKGIWSRFVKGVKEYALVEAGDEIAVCISGGKDSIFWRNNPAHKAEKNASPAVCTVECSEPSAWVRSR